MRAVWILVLVAGACGDNTRPARLQAVAALPRGTQDVAFDREGVPIARTSDGGLHRLVGERWRVVMSNGAARAVDFGTDNDGTLLVMSSIPRVLFQLDGGSLREVGGLVIANFVHMPVQVPSGNRYVQELAEPRRSFVLSPGTSTWAETPPMFFSRPVRAHDGTLLATAAAGVQRFEADGTRTLAIACAALGKSTCTPLVLAGTDGGRMYLADVGVPEILVVEDDRVDAVPLPEGIVPVRAATGAGLTVVLAKQDRVNPADERYYLFALAGRDLERLDSAIDPPTVDTRLAVDPEGVVYAATTALSRVLP